MKFLIVCIFGILFQICSSLKDGPRCENLELFKGNGDWRQVKEGNVTQLVAYKDYMYAIGTDKAVYKFALYNHGKWWKVAPGNVSSISIYDRTLYGVHEDGAVYTCTLRQCKKWFKITEGSVSSIELNDDYIFAIKPDMEDTAVWQTTWDGYWPYRRVTTGSTVDLAFSENYMYGLGSEGAVWKTTKDGKWPWKQVTQPHNITQIDASNNCVYGVDRDGGAWRTRYSTWSKYGLGTWKKIGGDLKVRHIAIQQSDCGAQIYAIGENYGVYRLP